MIKNLLLVRLASKRKGRSKIILLGRCASVYNVLRLYAVLSVVSLQRVTHKIQRKEMLFDWEYTFRFQSISLENEMEILIKNINFN